MKMASGELMAPPTRPQSLDADKITHQGNIELSNFSAVASYNWLDEPHPTILVPGIPPFWSPPFKAPTMKPDNGIRYLDQNADRIPCSPWEPVVCAIETYRSDFDFRTIDIITDQRSLRQLYKFAGRIGETFEISVDFVGSSVVFTPIKPWTRVTVLPNKHNSYRQSFEEEHTKIHSFAKGSISHYRLITYTLGRLHFLVRSATDAYRASNAGGLPMLAVVDDYTQEKFTSNIETVSWNEEKGSTLGQCAPDELQVIKGGFDVPQAAVLEISTRASPKTPINESKMIELYLAQTPCFIKATVRSEGPAIDWALRRARVGNIDVQDVTESNQQWERDHQGELRELIDLLKQIMSRAQDMGCPCIVESAGEGDLRIQGVGDRRIPTLSDKAKALFLGNPGSNALKRKSSQEVVRVDMKKQKDHESLA